MQCVQFYNMTSADVILLYIILYVMERATLGHSKITQKWVMVVTPVRPHMADCHTDLLAENYAAIAEDFT